MKLEPILHKALLAGVARVPLTPEAIATPALQSLLETVPAEARLWHTIAAADLWQRAGFQASLDSTSGTIACAGERVIGRPAEQVLQLILRGIHPELLGSWLAQARTANGVLPHACLVPMIELARQKSALRPAVAPLLGARGRWLVAQQPAWVEAFGEDVEGLAPADSWELGSLAQRVQALRALRGSDPQAALAMLDADWAQEPVENRIALLPCLATGISLADEAFLERALDDKRKEVRGAAQDLLVALPGSQLRARCMARLLPLLRFERTPAGPVLTVELAKACDKAMKRDGIGSVAHPGMGEKAGWLFDLMRCVSPQFWCEHWSLAPREVIALLAAQEFSAALLSGLAQAAGRALSNKADDAAIAWFVTLIGDSAPRAGIDLVGMLLPELESLPQDEQERIVAHWLGESANNPHAFAYAMHWAGQHTGDAAGSVSPHMSRMLLSHLQRTMASMPQPDYYLREHFRVLSRVLDAVELHYATANWPREDWQYWPQWRSLTDDLMDTLNFRHTMQASFLENDA